MCSLFVRASNPLLSRVYQNYHMTENVFFRQYDRILGKIWHLYLFTQAMLLFLKLQILCKAGYSSTFACVSQAYHLNFFLLLLIFRKKWLKSCGETMQFGLVSLITDSGGNSWCPWLYFLRAYHLDNLCSSKSDVRLRFWSWFSTSLHTAARHKGRQSGAIKSHFPTMRGKYVSIDN